MSERWGQTDTDTQLLQAFHSYVCIYIYTHNYYKRSIHGQNENLFHREKESKSVGYGEALFAVGGAGGGGGGGGRAADRHKHFIHDQNINEN